MERDCGYVQDVCADLETGKITSIIVPGSNKVLNIFSQENEIVIPCGNITKVLECSKVLQFYYGT